MACNEIADKMKPVGEAAVSSTSPNASEKTLKPTEVIRPYLTRSSSRLRGEEPIELELPSNLPKKKRFKRTKEFETKDEDNEEDPDEKKEGKEEEQGGEVSSPINLQNALSMEVTKEISNAHLLLELSRESHNSQRVEKETNSQRLDQETTPLILTTSTPQTSNQLIFDRDFAEKLFSSVIQKTRGFSVEKLLQIRSTLLRFAFEHRTNCDKTNLLQQTKEYFQQENLFPS